MKNLIIFALCLFLTPVVSGAVKIGIVDMQRAIQQTKAGKKAKKTLESQFNSKKKELQKKEADLKKMGQDLEKKAMVLSDDVKMKKQRELQQAMVTFQKLVQESQQNIQKKERDLTQPIIEKMLKVIDKVAEKKGYDFILQKGEQNVIWAKKSHDLTSEIVKAFEKTK